MGIDFGDLAVNSSIIQRDSVHRVVSLLLEADDAVDDGGPVGVSADSALRVIDAFLVPKFRYDPVKKHFFECVFVVIFISPL